MLRTLISSPLDGLILLVYMLPAYIVGLTIHEWAHAFTDYKLGNKGQKLTGRLSLNPLRHIDWGGFILFLLLGFGWAKPVTTNAYFYKNRRRGKILTSLAGILANLALCFVVTPFYFITARLAASTVWTVVSEVLYFFLYVNSMLAVLNLIPFPPLDGSKVLRELVPSKLNLWVKMDQYGIIVLLLLSFTGILGTVINFLQTGVMNGLFWFWALFF